MWLTVFAQNPGRSLQSPQVRCYSGDPEDGGPRGRLKALRTGKVPSLRGKEVKQYMREAPSTDRLSTEGLR